MKPSRALRTFGVLQQFKHIEGEVELFFLSPCSCDLHSALKSALFELYDMDIKKSGFCTYIDQKEILVILKRISELLDSWSFLVLVRLLLVVELMTMALVVIAITLL